MLNDPRLRRRWGKIPVIQCSECRLTIIVSRLWLPFLSFLQQRQKQHQFHFCSLLMAKTFYKLHCILLFTKQATKIPQHDDVSIYAGTKNNVTVKVKPADKLASQQSPKQSAIQSSYFVYSRKLAHANIEPHAWQCLLFIC